MNLIFFRTLSSRKKKSVSVEGFSKQHLGITITESHMNISVFCWYYPLFKHTAQLSMTQHVKNVISIVTSKPREIIFGSYPGPYSSKLQMYVFTSCL